MLRALTRIGVFRGLLGGNRGLLALGAAATGLRVVAKVVRKEPEVVFSEQLDPGQTLLITHLTHHVK